MKKSILFLISFNAFAYCPLHPKTFMETLDFASKSFSGINSAICRNSVPAKKEYGDIMVIEGDGVINRGIPPRKCKQEIQVTYEKNPRGEYQNMFKLLNSVCN